MKKQMVAKRVLAMLTAAVLTVMMLVAGVTGNAAAAEHEGVRREAVGEATDESAGEAAEEIAENAQFAVARPSMNGALHVEGTQLVDNAGRPVQLRGISTHGMAWFPQYINDACFRELSQEWNVNVIRLAMYTAEYNGYCSGGNQTDLKEMIRRGVQYASMADCYVIIDWHILSDGNPLTYREEAKAFFSEMSAAFAGQDNIIYEICNEPNGGTTWDQVREYAPEVIDTIRAQDGDAVILVGTPNWCQYVDQAAAKPLGGYDNLMYTLHFYAATHKGELRQSMNDALDEGLPIFVSEYGICDASGNGAIDEEEANAWVEAMDARGVSYVMWNLSNKDETSSVLQSGCTRNAGFEDGDLSQAGLWLKSILGAGTSDAEAATEQQTGEQTGDGEPGGKAKQEGAAAEEPSGKAVQEGAAEEEPGGKAEQEGAAEEETAVSSGLEYEAQVVNSWESGGEYYYQYNLTLKNTSGQELNGWSVELIFSEEPSLSDGWNGNYRTEGTVLYITSKDYNARAAAGKTVSDVGFIISGSSELHLK